VTGNGIISTDFLRGSAGSLLHEGCGDDDG